jgi:hypothetical protein
MPMSSAVAGFVVRIKAVGDRPLLPRPLFKETAVAVSSFVMPGLDPGIHLSSQEASCEEDGLPGQARQ